MIKHRRGLSFDYVLILEGVKEGEFAGWDVSATFFRDGWDQDTTQSPAIVAEWADSSHTSVHVLAVDTTHWTIGRSSLDLRFSRPVDGYVRGLTELVEWQIVK